MNGYGISIGNDLISQGNRNLRSYGNLGASTRIGDFTSQSPGTSGLSNDMSLTNSYLNALKSQQEATRAAQALSIGDNLPGTESSTSALPGYGGMNQSQLQGLLRGLFGIQPTGTMSPTGMNASTWNNDINRGGGLSLLQQQTPLGSQINPYTGNDVTRLSNNPFATTSAARDLFR